MEQMTKLTTTKSK